MNRVQALRRAETDLITGLRDAQSPAAIEAAAGEIYQHFLDTGSVDRAGLRDLLKDLLEGRYSVEKFSDDKQASTLQLLGEVRDDDAFGLFVSVLKQYRSALDDRFRLRGWVPSKRATAAVTFIRCIKIPDQELETTANLVNDCVRCFDPPREYTREYKQFNLGALVTLGTISRLDWSHRPFREVLAHSSDYDVMQEALEGLSKLVQRYSKHGSDSRSKLSSVSRDLMKLLDRELEQPADSSALAVRPAEFVINAALLILAQIKPDAVRGYLLKLASTLCGEHSDYLRGTVRQVLGSVSKDYKRLFFRELIDTLSTEELATFLSRICE